MFSIRSQRREGRCQASDLTGNLKPATTSEVADALTRAILYDGKRIVHDADLIIGRVTAAGLVEHLRDAGYMIVKTRGGALSGASGMAAPLA
jgi:hypothetical protein